MSLMNICSTLSLSLSLSLSVSENLDFCKNYYYWNLDYDTWCSRMCLIILNTSYKYIRAYSNFRSISIKIYCQHNMAVIFHEETYTIDTQIANLKLHFSLLFKRHMQTMTKEMICISISTFILKFALNSGMAI